MPKNYRIKLTGELDIQVFYIVYQIEALTVELKCFDLIEIFGPFTPIDVSTYRYCRSEFPQGINNIGTADISCMDNQLTT